MGLSLPSLVACESAGFEARRAGWVERSATHYQAMAFVRWVVPILRKQDDHASVVRPNGSCPDSSLEARPGDPSPQPSASPGADSHKVLNGIERHAGDVHVHAGTDGRKRS